MNENNFRYEYFFDSSPDLLCIAGYDGYFKRINPAVSKLLGYTHEELFARPIREFIYPPDREITAQYRTELLHAKPLSNFENRYVTKSGELVWLSWTSMPVESDQLIFAIAKDITHKKKLEEERNALLANLTQMNQDLKQLTYTTSHDLRSPVNNLLTIFSLLDSSRITDPETLELIDILKLTTAELKSTLDKYVDELGQNERLLAKSEEVPLQQTLAKVQQSVAFLIQASRATIDADFSGLPALRFNTAFMESIFLNLITNSIKYARPGYQPVITIRSERADGQKRLIFSDNGLGFDMEQVRSRIFGLYQKFHSHTDSKGIGLYLVYNHVSSFGGDISVQSTPNQGTTFTISFKNQRGE
jgi:PAS domain S-box-containing protein